MKILWFLLCFCQGISKRANIFSLQLHADLIESYFGVSLSFIETFDLLDWIQGQSMWKNLLFHSVTLLSQWCFPKMKYIIQTIWEIKQNTTNACPSHALSDAACLPTRTVNGLSDCLAISKRQTPTWPVARTVVTLFTEFPSWKFQTLSRTRFPTATLVLGLWSILKTEKQINWQTDTDWLTDKMTDWAARDHEERISVMLGGKSCDQHFLAMPVDSNVCLIHVFDPFFSCCGLYGMNL